MHNNSKPGTARNYRTYVSGLVAACGVVLAASALPVWSQDDTGQDGAMLLLDPITVEGNSLYGMDSTEKTGGYAAAPPLWVRKRRLPCAPFRNR